MHNQAAPRRRRRRRRLLLPCCRRRRLASPSVPPARASALASACRARFRRFLFVFPSVERSPDLPARASSPPASCAAATTRIAGTAPTLPVAKLDSTPTLMRRLRAASSPAALAAIRSAGAGTLCGRSTVTVRTSSIRLGWRGRKCAAAVCPGVRRCSPQRTNFAALNQLGFKGSIL